MKRQPRTEIVSVRLTLEEKHRLDEMGGATKVIRDALRLHWPTAAPAGQCAASTQTFTVWHDGTVGPAWPALASA